MKVSDNFDLREFIDPVTYSLMGEKSVWLLDHRIVDCVQLLRDLTQKSVTVNDWHIGGHFKESGSRDFFTRTGAKYSQHKLFRAADVKVPGMEAETVRQFIRDNFSDFKAVGLTTIEKDTPTWVHLDCRFTGLETLLEVNYR